LLEKNPMTISETLRDAMEQSDLSLYRIAKDAGLEYGCVHRFYYGTRGLTLDSADKLADYFGLELQPTAKTKGRKSHGR